MGDTTEDTGAAEDEQPPSIPEKDRFRGFALIVGAGWLSTNIGYSISDLPMRFMLKDHMHLGPEAVAAFFFWTQATNYIKPIAGVLTDYVPLLGTRRRHYLLLSLLACGSMWLLLGVVPQTYRAWLLTYAFLHIFIVLISTTLGGFMVEGGARYRATGRLSAQRVGIFRVVGVIGGPLGGWLSGRSFLLTATLTSISHFILVPLFGKHMKEAGDSKLDSEAIVRVRGQARDLMRSGTLWSAAALIFLVIAAPGYETTLLYYQTNTLGFSKQFIGNLGAIKGVCGVLGAYAFSVVCRTCKLRSLLYMGIIVHVFAALMFLEYKSHNSALLITGAYEAAQTLALLPLYDLIMRVTPKGSEAIGYAIMMSVFNITTRLSDILGAFLYERWHSFTWLILINAASTALVLLFIPFLPRTATERRETDPSPDSELAGA
jgi:predicted MFS family arabinose efflux permease